MDILLPEGWPKPKGYSNGIVAEGKMVFIAGQIGWDENQEFKSSKLHIQFEQALLNILSVLKEANGTSRDIVRMTWFITSKEEYKSSLKEIGATYKALMGKHYPVMSVVEVSGLIEDKAVIEIETTAVLPS